MLEGLELRALPAGGPPGTINEFPTPTARAFPVEITTGPDGNLWFTEQRASKVATLDPSTNAITEYPIPTRGGGPYTITPGPDGNLWFTEYLGNKIGMINPSTHAIAEFNVPTPNSLPLWITTGPDGNLWFTEQAGNNIGKLDPSTGAITEFLVPTRAANLQVIAPGSDGNLWFTEFAGNKIARIIPATGAITEIPLPGTIGGPEGLTGGADGQLWFTNVDTNSIASIDPNTFALANYPVPSTNSFLGSIVSGSDGRLAFTENLANKIGQFDIASHAFAETSIPTANTRPNGITPGPDGNLWFAETTGNQIGQFILPAPLTVTAGRAVVATENTPFTATVATFTATNPSSTAGDFTAMIDWGDGSTPAFGAIDRPSPGGPFRVAGGHSYAFASPRTITVTVFDFKASIPRVPLSAAATTTATILDAPLTTSGVALFLITGAPFGGDVGSFTDADPGATAGNYTASIDWGDDTITPGTVTRGTPTGPFFVGGSHTYATPGRYRVTGLIRDFAGSTATFQTPAVVVTPPPVIASSVVTNTNDSGPGSLRQAILNANQNPGRTITFAIPAAGFATIAPLSPLPAIVGRTTIDGESQARFEGFADGRILVQIAGGGAGPSEGLVVGPDAGGSIIQGLAIYGFSASQIDLVSDADVVRNCDIGLPAAPGAAASASTPDAASAGVYIQGADALIGGAAAADRNAISGNAGSGIVFAGARALHGRVQGNYVGLDPTGTVARPNLIDGIVIGFGAGFEAIGAGNVVSGNLGIGIELLTTMGNLVYGNKVGTDPAGLAAIGNGGAGLCIDLGSVANTVGGASPGSGNLLSGNNQSGIALQGASTGNAVEGNRIGTDALGVVSIANGVGGVLINSASGNAIGPGNVVSGNLGNGIELLNSSGNAIMADLIGTDSAGTRPLGNTGSGICLDLASSGNDVGGPSPMLGNTISGNKANGVAIQFGSDGNQVRNNRIGTDGGGNLPLGNGIAGVLVSDSAGNLVGPGNLVSGNGVASPGAGIWVDGPGSTFNHVFGNLVGTNLSGLGAIPNAVVGILVNEASDNLVGGPTPGQGNLVSGNTLIGVFLAGLGATRNQVQGNVIGTDASGIKALGNGSKAQGDGLYLLNAPGNLIGGATPSAGNTISGNPFDGVELFGPGSTANLLQGNRIGTDGLGAGALGNGKDGILLDGASGNRIVSNVIAANGRNGIFLSGSSNTRIVANAIGLGIGGQPLGNGSFGILISNNSPGTVASGNVNQNNKMGAVRDTDSSPVGFSPSTSTVQVASKAKARAGHAVTVQPRAKSFAGRPAAGPQAHAKASPKR